MLKKNRFEAGIELTPTNIEGIGGVDLTREGEIDVDSDDSRLKVRVEAATRTVVTEDQTQTVTNKTINVDNNTVSNIEVDNLKAGVLNTSTTLTGVSDTQVPSALAVKTYVDNKAAAQNEASEISFTPTGTIIATDVQAAIAEVSSDIDNHISDATDAHDASAISNSPSGNLAATDVQGALNELQTDINTRATSTALTNHLNDTTDAHDASAISSVASGNLVATDVQAALNELQSDIDTKVTGAASSTDNAIVRFDGTTGKLVQNSTITISDTGVLTSAVTTGTAPLVIASTTKVNNLHVARATLGDTVTTNANLTGPITSIGNATSVAAQTGTGTTFVMNTSPTLVTPVLGVATATSVNGTTIPTSKTLVVTTDKLSVHAATTSSELAGVISDETGSGALVFATSPTLITPNIGVASGTSLATTGNIGVGASVSSTAIINSLGASITSASGNTQYGLIMSPTIAGSTAMATLSSNWSRIATLAGSTATLTDAINYDAVNLSKNGSGAITNSTGLMLRDQTNATNNYGIQNAITSGANKWGYYGSGTANNALAGNTRFGSVVAPTSTVDVTGTIAASTSVTAPIVIGGTGTTSNLTLKPTSGVGTTGSDIILGVGNNGATEAMRILNDGKIGVGTASPGSKLQVNQASVDPSSINGVIRSALTPSYTADNATSSHTLYAEVHPVVSSGVNHTGADMAVFADARVSSASNLGTATSLRGFSAHYGISSTGSGAVTQAFGLRLDLYAQAGTIGSAYGLYLAAPQTGGTLTNEYGVYSASPTAKNYFSGPIGAGTTSMNAYEKIRIGGSLTGSTSINAVTNAVAIQSDVTSIVSLYNTFPSTQATAFTLGTLSHYSANQGTKGAGSTITEQIGFVVGSSLTGATTNTGFKSNLAAASGAWNFYAAGTANNAFNGNTKIGATTEPISTLDIQGSVSRTVTSSATGTTLGITHSTFVLTATGQTVTLPTAVGITGREYTIKLTASGTGTIDTTSSQTIDAATTYSLSAQYKYVTVVSDGSNWLIVGNN